MTTNYTDTFIRVASDCPVQEAQTPPAGKTGATVAQLQHALLIDAPYTMTSDDLLFEVHAIRQDISEEARTEARRRFFAKPQACLRSSPLTKRYGWGIHSDAQSRVALVALGSGEYLQASDDTTLRQVEALRSKRG